MFHFNFMRHIGVMLILTTCTLQTYCQDLRQEKSAPIEFRHQAGPNKVAQSVATYSPDRSVVARVVGERGKWNVQLFDAAKKTPLGQTIELKAKFITALAVSPDNSTVATAIGSFSDDWGEVRIWNGKSGKEIDRYRASRDKGLPDLGNVSRLSFSDDGKTVTIVSGPAGGK